MSLIYSLCARGNQTVLANYSPFSGNFQTIAIDVLRKLNLSKTYGQYGTAKYNFYSFIKEGFVFLVMVQVQYEMRIAIAFLRDIQEIFFRKYPKQRRDQAVAYSLSDFKQTLQERIALFNDKAKVDKFCALQKQLSEAEQISLRNLDKAIDRGERIQILVKKTQVMAETSYDMNQQAKTVKRTMWWKNKKLMIGIILLVLLIIFILVWIICGGRFQKCR